jgi:alpha-glucosidase
MLGGDLLIAPPATWESPAPYRITLPGAGWYDYWTGLPLAGAETTETPTLDHLPVFIRPGAILPRQPLVQSTAETPRGRLQLAIYPGANCQGALYLDDGESFAYKRDGYLRQQVTCDATSLSFGKRDGNFTPWWTGFDVVIHGWTGPAPRVRLDGRAVAAKIDAAAHTISFTLPDIAHPARVTIGG